MEAIIASIQLGVPLDAHVERLRECSGEWEAERDAATSESHAMAEVGVGGVALRWRPDVHHLPPVVLAEHGDEVVRAQHGVVVDKHEPPRARPSANEAHGLSGDACDPEPRRVARGVGVPEARGVLRHPDRREGALPGGARPRRGGRARVEPDVAAHRGGVPPQADVLAAARPEMRRPRDAEDDVAERERRGRAGARGRGRGARIRQRRVLRCGGGGRPLGRGEHEEEPERGGEQHREQRQQGRGKRALPRRDEREWEERRLLRRRMRR